MHTIDAKGLACPQPVILAKKSVDSGETEFAVLVDNTTAVENLTRLAQNSGYQVSSTEENGIFTVAFSKDGSAVPVSAPETSHAPETNGKWAVFAPSDSLGRGDSELGASLIKMFFYTLTQEKDVPDYILLMNAGVTLACNEEISGHLQTLAEMGSEILVCGTCLNYYGLKEEVKVGTVSNMYDIVSCMKKASKVTTL